MAPKRLCAADLSLRAIPNQAPHMIQEFKVKNYLSFRDEATFSFLATDDRSFGEDQVVTIGKTRLLRFAVLYGANASGKSNLLQAFDFLRKFWLDDLITPNRATGATPFLLDQETMNEPSRFELTFFVGEVCYRYTLSLDNKRVYEETLHYYPGEVDDEVMLLHRIFQDNRSVITFGDMVQVSPAVLEELTIKCLPSVSFFTARSMVNTSLPLIDDAYNWAQEHIPTSMFPGVVGEEYHIANKIIGKDPDVRDFLSAFMRRADFNITGINVETETIEMTDEIRNYLERNVGFPNGRIRANWQQPTYNRYDVNFEHTVKNKHGMETYPLPRVFQSDGTNRLYGVEAAIYDTEKRNGFLAIDEIESSLHPELVKLILDQYLNSEGRSQLLVTTHYDPLLDEIDHLFRKDSVWFTEKGEDGNTSLYSLVEFRGLDEQQYPFRSAYRNGRFGALPNTY